MSEQAVRQIKRLAAPLLWNILYLFVCSGFDEKYRVYCDMVFYLGLAIYFICIGTANFKKLWDSWKSGGSFWLPVLFTVLGMAAAFGLGMAVSLLFPGTSDGMSVFKLTDAPSLIAFALTTVLLPPIAEEAFYRKEIINFSSKTSLILTSAAGILLYAGEHSLMPLGLLVSSIWAIPMTIAYIKSKNVYIPMTAHFLCNLAVNGMTIIFTAAALLSA